MRFGIADQIFLGHPFTTMSVAASTRSRGQTEPPSSAKGAGSGLGGRVEPHNIDAEQGLLASCLLENGADVLNDCLAVKMRPEYFYRPPHQLIFEASSL